MSELTISDLNGGGDVEYRTSRLNAFDQFHVIRRIAPLLTGLGTSISLIVKLSSGETALTKEENSEMFSSMGPVANALANMTDADCNYVLKKCLVKVQRFNNERWSNIMTPDGQLMFEDLDLSAMMKLTLEVLRENLGPFLSGLLPQDSLEEQPSTSTQ